MKDKNNAKCGTDPFTVATASIMCVALTYAEHRFLTQRIRQEIAYRGAKSLLTTESATTAIVLAAHEAVYTEVGVDKSFLARAATTVPILKP